MAKWEELSMRDRSQYMRLAVQNGYKDIRTIREAYNKYAEGGPKEKMDEEEGKGLSLLEKAKLFVSSDLMNSFRNIRNNIASYSEEYDDGIKQKPLYSKSNYDDIEAGVPQATYLMDRDTQRKVFLRKGYLEGKEGDYGIVKRAVGNRDIPVYQTEPDDIDRSQLIPIGNVKNLILKNANDSREDILRRNLKHAGTYSGTIYLGTDGNLYGKNWDLNDYGPDVNGKGGDTGFMDFATRTLDSIGSPTVINTGFKRLDNVDWMIADDKPRYLDLEQRKKYYPKYAEEWFEQHPEIQYLPETGKFQYVIPEVTVTAHRKKANGGNLYETGGPKGNIYEGEGENTQQMNKDYDRETAVNVAKTIGGFIPIVGTTIDAYDFVKEPSWENAGNLGLSLASDVFPLLKGAKALKAAKAATEMAEAAEIAKRAEKMRELSAARRRVAKLEEAATRSNINPNKIAKAKSARGRAYNAALKARSVDTHNAYVDASNMWFTKYWLPSTAYNTVTSLGQGIKNQIDINNNYPNHHKGEQANASDYFSYTRIPDIRYEDGGKISTLPTGNIEYFDFSKPSKGKFATKVSDDFLTSFANDYAYRWEKEHGQKHPNIDNSKIINIKFKGNPDSKKVAGSYNVVSNEIKLWPEWYVTPSEAHELSHALRATQGYNNIIAREWNIDSGTDNELNILKEAYPDIDVSSYGIFDSSRYRPNIERFSSNTELREIIAQDNNNVRGKQLDKLIDSLNDETLLYYYNKIENGYLPKIKDLKKWKKLAPKVKKALKEVALITSDYSDVNYV